MSPERWRQIEEMFQAAQQWPEPQRTQYLQEQCGGDIALREEVQSLLERETRAESLLGTPAWQRGSLLLNTASQDESPHFVPGVVRGRLRDSLSSGVRRYGRGLSGQGHSPGA